MKNFPSALIKQQNTKNGLGNTMADTLKNIGTKAMSNILSGGKSQKDSKKMAAEFESGYIRPELNELVEEMNILNPKEATQKLEDKMNSPINLKFNTQNGKAKADSIVFEDPFKFSSTIFSVINNYQYILGFSLPSIYDQYGEVKAEGDKITSAKMSVIHSGVVPSLFNPFAGIRMVGMSENIPLIDRKIGNVSGSLELGDPKLGDGQKIGDLQLTNRLWTDRKDLSDCSIKTLVELSKGNSPELGLATYRYIDFMYCKDLGKIPNNRLITLRRFPAPIGDNIFKYAHPSQNNKLLKAVPDIGRLITWFDNEDNKLENICRYNYWATWKEFTSEIQQQQTQDRNDGFVNKLANTFSVQNNDLVAKGFSGNTGLLGLGAQMLNIPVLSGAAANDPYYDLTTLTNYDKNRIYTPKDTIWSTHKYEGKLEFNQEITLTFRYQLRSYANINPRAALLDLIGNIQTVTYKRGNFWGGEIKMYGPQGNSSMYDKANIWVDKAFEKVGGIWRKLLSGEFDIETLQNTIENAINKAGDFIKSAATTAQGLIEGDPNTTQTVKDAAVENGKKAAEKITEVVKKNHIDDALKGMVKNALGRPAIYALNSILTGEEVGPWHLTIGNPRNPIMSIGNLILTNAEVFHSGPLGIDDFPTEIAVTVTLKHAMPRDSVGIQKMYTKGLGSIYKPMNLIDTSKYVNNENAFGDIVNLNKNEVLAKNLAAL